MKIKYLILALFFIFVAVTQTALFGSYNKIMANANLLLVVMIIMISFREIPKALVAIFVGAVILDIYSGLPFGIFLLTYLSTLAVIEFSFLNFFTNYSLYSLISLGVIGILAYNFFFWIFSGIFFLAGMTTFSFGQGVWTDIIIQLFELLVMMLLAHYFLSNWFKRFNPLFLKS